MSEVIFMSNKTVGDVFNAMPFSLRYRIEMAAGAMLDEEVDPSRVDNIVRSITKDVYDNEERFKAFACIVYGVLTENCSAERREKLMNYEPFKLFTKIMEGSNNG